MFKKTPLDVYILTVLRQNVFNNKSSLQPLSLNYCGKNQYRVSFHHNCLKVTKCCAFEINSTPGTFL